MTKSLFLFAVLTLVSVLAQNQNFNLFSSGRNNLVDASCFQCSSLPVSSSFQSSSALSADDACRNAQMMAELDMRRQCSGFSCSQEQQQNQEGMNLGCGLSISNTTCRRRVVNPQGSNLWLCSFCCEGSCACAQALRVVESGAATTTTTEAPIPVTPAAETTQAPTQGQTLQAFQLTHIALGQAQLRREATNEFNETVLVTGLTGSGQNGVLIDLPQGTQRHTITMEVLNNFNRGSLLFTPSGNIRNIQNINGVQQPIALLPGTENVQDIWSFRLRSRGDGAVELIFIPGSLEFNSLQVESAVGETDILGSFQVSIDSLEPDQVLAVFPAGRFTVVPWVSELNGAPAIVIMFERESQVMLMSSQAQNIARGDRVILRALDANAGPLRVTELTSTQILGTDMEGFRILREEFSSDS